MDQNDTTGRVRSIIGKNRPDLGSFEAVYKDLHQHPELGTQESRTSSIVAKHLQEVGYTVVDRIGGHGLVGILENGQGPTIMFRADMDALPIREETGVQWASQVESVDTDGEKKPVMHACGHDMHVTSAMAVSTLLAQARSEWKGTLLMLFQPDEEHGAGAQAMLDDGLYTKVPKPDVVFGQHISSLKTGIVRIKPGVFMASADTLKVTVFGRGAHGARPQDSIDPIVLAASIILRLQTVVAREIAPSDVASVTCASIHGGKAHNVIPYEVEFFLNIRTFNDAVREEVIGAVKRIIKGEAIASGVQKEPTIETVGNFPLTVNDEATAHKIDALFRSYFGEQNVLECPLVVASEDFSLLATSIGVRSAFWNFGSIDTKTWSEYERTGNKELIPQPHQNTFCPEVSTTLRTAVDAMSLVLLEHLGR